jgi:aspartate carbamoyltransferase catalytic subunit
MKHFLDSSQFYRDDIMALIDRAMFFKNNRTYPCYSHIPMVNLFYENSTRTRVSFELAAKQLGMPVINFDLQKSSESKGEVCEDTIKTLGAMGIKIAVIRHVQERFPHLLSELSDGMPIINAGDGTNEHPSQALLDIMTILEHKSTLEGLKIAIIGNIKHSRVANSLQGMLAHLKPDELVMVAPTLWQPSKVHFGRVTSSLSDGLREADVIICLRVQRERLAVDETIDLARYRRDYALTKTTLAYAKKDAMVMHPGPVNRGVEIDSDVADGSQSYILQQVTNGVFMRMAILESFAKTIEKKALGT